MFIFVDLNLIDVLFSLIINMLASYKKKKKKHEMTTEATDLYLHNSIEPIGIVLLKFHKSKFTNVSLSDLLRIHFKIFPFECS